MVRGSGRAERRASWGYWGYQAALLLLALTCVPSCLVEGLPEPKELEPEQPVVDYLGIRPVPTSQIIFQDRTALKEAFSIPYESDVRIRWVAYLDFNLQGQKFKAGDSEEPGVTSVRREIEFAGDKAGCHQLTFFLGPNEAFDKTASGDHVPIVAKSKLLSVVIFWIYLTPTDGGSQDLLDCPTVDAQTAELSSDLGAAGLFREPSN